MWLMSCPETFYVFFSIIFSHLKTSPHLLQLFRRMMLTLFCWDVLWTAELHQTFVDND